jgi:tetratricopeptide (TPR) repeat protein
VGLESLAHYLSDHSQRALALEHCHEARELLAQVVKEEPVDREHRYHLAHVIQLQSLLWLESTEMARAETGFRDAWKRLEALVAEAPREVKPRETLADITNNLAGLLALQGRTNEVERPLKRSIELVAQLSEEHPRIVEYRERLALSSINCGSFLRGLGKPTEALDWFDRGILEMQSLGGQDPDSARWQDFLAGFFTLRGSLKLEQLQGTDAAEDFRGALGVLERLLADHPPTDRQRVERENQLQGLAAQLIACGDQASADRAAALMRGGADSP